MYIIFAASTQTHVNSFSTINCIFLFPSITHVLHDGPDLPRDGVSKLTHHPASCFSGSTCAGCWLTGRNNLNSGGNSYVHNKGREGVK